MQVSTIREAVWTKAVCCWRAMSRRKKIGPGLAVILMLIAGTLFWQWWTSWPPYAVLRAPKAPADLPPVPDWSWPHAFSPDGKILATGTPAGVAFWDADTGRLRKLLPRPDGRWAYDGAFSPDGQTLVSLWSLHHLHKPGGIDLIDVASGKVRTSIKTDFSAYNITFRDGGRILRVVGGNDKKGTLTEALYDLATGEPISMRSLSIPIPTVRLAFSPDGRLLAGVPYGSKSPAYDVMLWDIDEDRVIGPVPTGLGSLDFSGLSVSPDGRTLAIGRQDGSTEFWDIATRRLRTSFRVHSAGFTSQTLEFSPDGSTLVSLGQFAPVRPTPSLSWVHRQIALLRKDRNWEPPFETVVIDMATGKRLGLLPSEGRPVFSPDGRTLATTHEDGDVRLRRMPGKR